MRDGSTIAWRLFATRTQLVFKDRQHLLDRQQMLLARFMAETLPRAPYYKAWAGKPLSELPMADKALLMGEFDGLNTRGITRERALAVALEAERSRDFAPAIGDVSVGLSSGTSGNRGLFLVSRDERLHWAGVLLARTLSDELLARLISPWRKPLQVAFFLRANSNLYTTLSSRRLQFRYYDLLDGLETQLAALTTQQPDVLVAPASALRLLAEAALASRCRLQPRQVISVAEVLEPDDARRIEQAFGRRVHQLYQCTEGFLAYTCEAGTLHLNESFVHFEQEWLDAEQTRFHPVITDFSRRTQLIVRYRLNDVLRLAAEPCSCGRAEQAIAAVEGRADEVLWLPDAAGTLQPVFPDFIRRAMLLAGDGIADYRAEQDGMQLCLTLASADTETAEQAARRELTALWHRLKLMPPRLRFAGQIHADAGAKRRRIVCRHKPGGN